MRVKSAFSAAELKTTAAALRLTRASFLFYRGFTRRPWAIRSRSCARYRRVLCASGQERWK